MTNIKSPNGGEKEREREREREGGRERERERKLLRTEANKRLD